MSSTTLATEIQRLGMLIEQAPSQNVSLSKVKWDLQMQGFAERIDWLAKQKLQQNSESLNAEILSAQSALEKTKAKLHTRLAEFLYNSILNLVVTINESPEKLTNPLVHSFEQQIETIAKRLSELENATQSGEIQKHMEEARTALSIWKNLQQTKSLFDPESEPVRPIVEDQRLPPLNPASYEGSSLYLDPYSYPLPTAPSDFATRSTFSSFSSLNLLDTSISSSPPLSRFSSLQPIHTSSSSSSSSSRVTSQFAPVKSSFSSPSSFSSSSPWLLASTSTLASVRSSSSSSLTQCTSLPISAPGKGIHIDNLSDTANCFEFVHRALHKCKIFDTRAISKSAEQQIKKTSASQMGDNIEKMLEQYDKLSSLTRQSDLVETTKSEIYFQSSLGKLEQVRTTSGLYAIGAILSDGKRTCAVVVCKDKQNLVFLIFNPLNIEQPVQQYTSFKDAASSLTKIFDSQQPRYFCSSTVLVMRSSIAYSKQPSSSPLSSSSSTPELLRQSSLPDPLNLSSSLEELADSPVMHSNLLMKDIQDLNAILLAAETTDRSQLQQALYLISRMQRKIPFADGEMPISDRFFMHMLAMGISDADYAFTCWQGKKTSPDQRKQALHRMRFEVALEMLSFAVKTDQPYANALALLEFAGKVLNESDALKNLETLEKYKSDLPNKLEMQDIIASIKQEISSKWFS
jgi:hypothetical protein